MSSTMKAAVVTSLGAPLEIKEVAKPDVTTGKIVVKMQASGVCHTDLHAANGDWPVKPEPPFIPGHEGVGIVEEVGSHVTRVSVGDRVALRESRTIGALGTGHMAEFAIQDESEVIALPRDIDNVERWMIEPVACCINSVDLAPIVPGSRVALVGSGFMGSVVLQLLAASPASSIGVFDLRDESLSYARSFTDRAPIEVYDLRDAPNLDELVGTYDIVFEAAAVEPAFRLANSLVRSGGTFAIFSWHHHPITFDFGDWHVRGITVLNTSPAAAPNFSDCFRRAVPLLASKKIDLEPLVTHVGRPEEASAIYRDGSTKENGYIKGVIRWS